MLADDGPHGYLEAVAVAWSAQARPLGHERREKFVGAECCGDCHRVRVEVEKSTAALDRGAEVAQIAQAQRAGHVVGERTQCDESGPVRQPHRAGVDAVRHGLDAADAAHPQELKQRRAVERCAEREAEREGAGHERCLFTTRATVRAQGRRGEREHVPDRVVELADAGETGSEGDLRDRERSGLDEYPCRLCPLGPGERNRSGSDLGNELTVQLPLAVVEATGESGNTVTVDNAVRDQAHGPADEIGSTVPLGRTWGGVRTAALAGPEAGQLGCRCGRVEAHIVRLRGHRRAAGPAVDPGGHDGGEEPAVKAGILALHGAVALLVGDHPSMVAARVGEDQRLSDIAASTQQTRGCPALFSYAPEAKLSIVQPTSGNPAASATLADA